MFLGVRVFSFLFVCVSFFVSRGGGRREKKARSRKSSDDEEKSAFRSFTEIVPTASAERSRKTKNLQCLSELAHFFSLLFVFVSIAF